MMKKFSGLALLAMGMLVVSPVFGEDACCSKSASKTAKMECAAGYAKMNLTTEQKTKLTASQEECEKAGCTKESQEKFMADAKQILSVEQYAQLKTSCAKAAKKS